MAAWPGGPCPDCGDDMPPNMLRCMTCRAWLNPELTRPEPEVPQPFDLPEISPENVSKPADTAGQYVVCPCCQKELRVSNRFLGESVACKFCDEKFRLQFSGTLRSVGVYIDCPHCSDELRVARKYLGQEVVCRFCDGRIRLPAAAGEQTVN